MWGFNVPVATSTDEAWSVWVRSPASGPERAGGVGILRLSDLVSPCSLLSLSPFVGLLLSLSFAPTPHCASRDRLPNECTKFLWHGYNSGCSSSPLWGRGQGAWLASLHFPFLTHPSRMTTEPAVEGQHWRTCSWRALSPVPGPERGPINATCLSHGNNSDSSLLPTQPADSLPRTQK